MQHGREVMELLVPPGMEQTSNISLTKVTIKKLVEKGTGTTFLLPGSSSVVTEPTLFKKIGEIGAAGG